MEAGFVGHSTLDGLDKAGQKGRPAGQLRDQDGFVAGMRAVTDSAESIQCGDAKASGEVSIRASTDCGLFELPVHLFSDGAGLLVKRRHFRSPLHGRTIDSSADLQFALTIERLQGTESSIDASGVFDAGNAHVDHGTGFGGDYIRPRTTLHGSGVKRDAA